MCLQCTKSRQIRFWCFYSCLLHSPCGKNISLSFLSISLPFTVSLPPPHPIKTKPNKTTPACDSLSHLQPLTVDTALVHFMEPISTVLYISAQSCLYLGSLRDALPALCVLAQPLGQAGTLLMYSHTPDSACWHVCVYQQLGNARKLRPGAALFMVLQLTDHRSSIKNKEWKKQEKRG